MTLSPTQRRIRASYAGFMNSAKNDPKEWTRNGLKAMNEDRFLKQIDEMSPGLPDHERQRRAEALRKAHCKRIILKRWKKRA